MVDHARCTLVLFAAGLLGQLLTVFLLLHFVDARDSLRSSDAVSILAGSLVMASLFVLYMPFYYTVATSLSVQSLIMIDRAGGVMPLRRLTDTFVSDAILHVRLDSMARNGYVIRQGDTYCVTSKGMHIAKLFSTIKRIWALGPGG
jgi:hypothetical protein